MIMYMQINTMIYLAIKLTSSHEYTMHYPMTPIHQVQDPVKLSPSMNGVVG